MDVTVTVTINGAEKTIISDSQRTILDVLREDLHLTGTKTGCAEGRCGACSILMDGERVLACITPISQANKKSIITIEGLAAGDSLHPVQEAFLAEGAIQCGYCTPGMIMTAAALLKKNPNPTDEQIAAEMDVNICRCCGYTKIASAIRRAAKTIKGG